ncbi:MULTISPECIES: glycosyltransferase family 2 protein [Thermodesulfovibrio]|jgi:glycosyltransferase involved in cell wall biosynthesis|uniref:glycosyltransferase family 2 protein n=1 Tax=Thermodesulfovibrio TaxID=28261 RepID=UPI00261669A2|nr:glycosyltransferase family 2 protein [Thermodesulfovibrio sp.]
MTERKRTFEDKLISSLNSIRYSLTEPLILRIMRLLYEKDYRDKKEEPLISVYTPTYNRAKLLIERAVPSVLNQTYKNFEYIIVGDCCTDETEEVVTKIGDPRIRFYNLPKRGYRYPPTVENHWFAGPVVPANFALKLVRGKWIARIDDDDIWTEDHLEVLLRFAQEGNYEFVSSSYIAVRHGKEILVDVKDQVPRIGGTQTWLYRSYLKFMKYNINCWRKKWNRVNDTDLQDRFYKAGVRIGFLEKVTCYVLPRPGEETIGLEAYKLTAQDKLGHFAFRE